MTQIVKQYIQDAVTPSTKEFDTLVKSGTGVKSKPFTCHVMVTPKLAEHILEKYNSNNRSISKPHLDKLVREMSNGTFIGHVGDEACIDKKGTVGNGQHRLMGILKSGTNQSIVFRFGVSSDIKVVEGKGRTKSFSDTLMINGHSKYATETAALVTLALNFVSNPHAPGARLRNYKASDTEKNAFYINNRASLDSSLNFVLSNTIGKGVLINSTAGLLHWVLSQSTNGQAKADEFMRGIIAGANLSSTNPIMVARNRIIGTPHYREQAGREIGISLMVKAYNDWIDGKTWSTKMHTPSGGIPVISGVTKLAGVDVYV